VPLVVWQGREWTIAAYAMQAQGLPYKVVTSDRNVKVERPWGDFNVKVVGLLREAAQNLVSDGYCDEDDIHHQYGLRVASWIALQAGADEFRARYNAHNVGGPRGGVPDIRRKYRTRPAGVTSAAVFDVSRDWAAEYAHATGNAWHADVHFVQEYSEQLLDQLSSVQPALPSALAAWADVKTRTST